MLTDTQLLAFLCEALEPDDAAEVRAALADPDVAARLSLLARQLHEPPPPPAFRIPPPGVPGGQRPFLALHVPSDLHDGPITPGGIAQVRLEDPRPPDQVWLVVLRHTERWEVVFPHPGDARVRLDQLAPHPDGGRQLDLVVGPEVGEQRWAVALPSLGLSVEDAANDGWAGLRAGLLDGSVPVVAVALEVG